ncbi:MAG TPA: hypothetical protein PLT45_08360, partial [Smithella sp.]|nr:hypothetical protein [Smithella sp.]
MIKKHFPDRLQIGRRSGAVIKTTPILKVALMQLHRPVAINNLIRTNARARAAAGAQIFIQNVFFKKLLTLRLESQNKNPFSFSSCAFISYRDLPGKKMIQAGQKSFPDKIYRKNERFFNHNRFDTIFRIDVDNHPFLYYEARDKNDELPGGRDAIGIHHRGKKKKLKTKYCSPVAQSVEQMAVNHRVRG